MKKKCRQIVTCLSLTLFSMTGIPHQGQCVYEDTDPGTPPTPPKKYIMDIEENVVTTVLILGGFFLSFFFASRDGK